MKKIILAVLVATALVGCTPETKEVSNSWVLPPELQGCKVYALQNDAGSTMKVVVCPNTPSFATNERQGKVDVDTTVIYKRGE